MRSLPVDPEGAAARQGDAQEGPAAPHKAPKEVRRIFDHVHDKDERYELNLYVVGDEEEPEPDDSSAAGSHLPAERSPNT